jgi:hypothetical protein
MFIPQNLPWAGVQQQPQRPMMPGGPSGPPPGMGGVNPNILAAMQRMRQNPMFANLDMSKISPQYRQYFPPGGPTMPAPGGPPGPPPGGPPRMQIGIPQRSV